MSKFIEMWNDLANTRNFERGISDSILNNLLCRYTEPHRKYHNLSHIESMLGEFLQLKPKLEEPDLVLIALYFHDAIYNTTSKTNEEDSANLCAEQMTKLGFRRDEIKKVADMILATKSDRFSPERNPNLLVDIDRSILGSRLADYQSYAKGIRDEYLTSGFSTQQYCAGRIDLFLNMQLAKTTIFISPEFAHLDSQARQNMLWEKQELESELNALKLCPILPNAEYRLPIADYPSPITE
ncbi:MAG: hypothetical protein SVX43_06835 [Cyanobacteriota bacterium]|nr:hypothetical protein [Cyanobacteriota bacterium]